MTTKFAAFFLLTLLYSVITSIFLLFTLGASWMDKSWTPLATGFVDFEASFGLGLVDVAAAERLCQLVL